MGRLIDVDELKKHFTVDGYLPGFIEESIDLQPTAYDVEAVLEYLNDLLKDCDAQELDNYIHSEFTNGRRYAYEQAIDIVKRGGIE